MFLGRSAPNRTGVVDEDVDWADFGVDLLDESADRLPVAEIAGIACEVLAALGNVLADLGVCFQRGADADDIRARLGQCLREPAPDASAAPGYEGRLAVELKKIQDAHAMFLECRLEF